MPVAFEVPAEEDASLIKKHPPRRLRQLEERPLDTCAITQEALEEKVALANERRNQVKHEKLESRYSLTDLKVSTAYCWLHQSSL